MATGRYPRYTERKCKTAALASSPDELERQDMAALGQLATMPKLWLHHNLHKQPEALMNLSLTVPR